MKWDAGDKVMMEAIFRSNNMRMNKKSFSVK